MQTWDFFAPLIIRQVKNQSHNTNYLWCKYIRITPALSGVKTKPSRGHILGKLPQDRAHVPQKPDTTNYSEENKKNMPESII